MNLLPSILIICGLVTQLGIDWNSSFTMQKSVYLPNGVEISLISGNREFAVISVVCSCNYKIRINRGQILRIDGRGEFHEFIIGYIGYVGIPNFVVYPYVWTDEKCDSHFQKKILSLHHPISNKLKTKWIFDFEQKVVDHKIDKKAYLGYLNLIKLHAAKLSSLDYFKCIVLQGMSEYWFWLIEDDDAKWLSKTRNTFARARKLAKGKKFRPFKIAEQRWTSNARRIYLGE